MYPLLKTANVPCPRLCGICPFGEAPYPFAESLEKLINEVYGV